MGLRNRLRRRIAEGEEDAPGAVGFLLGQVLQRGAEGGEAEVGVALRTVHTIEEGGEVNELVPRVHEVLVEHLLASHSVKPIKRRPARMTTRDWPMNVPSPSFA